MKLINRMAIFCENKEQAGEFFKKCVESKFRWCNDEFIDPMKNSDNRFCEDGTYYFIDNNALTFSTARSSYRNYNYVNFKDLFKTESKFKVGDKVRVKNGLKVGIRYGDIEFLNIMDKYSGLKCTIESITTEGNYILKNGKYSLTYSAEMLEKVKEENKMSKCKVYEMPEYVRGEIEKVIINNRTVVVILKSGHKGVATCSQQDKFVESVGYQIALMRARINKKEDELKRKKQVLNRVTENPKLLDDFFIV
ncbi:hypothetical protein [Terrisporobacter sp.]|uniref:hypothetical protein n=1 Tax=Terrisporobacter sp. TaxID=1965305 RepID=UPI00289D1BAB|nr:hypothetical protein [Terrisporobacter sp.]